MEQEWIVRWESRLKELFDEIDDELENSYGHLYPLHPARPRRGSTSSREHDGLFNVGAGFSPGYGSRHGRGYVVDIDMVTLAAVPVGIRKAVEEDVERLLRAKLPRYYPGRELRVERDGAVLKIFGDLSPVRGRSMREKLKKYVKVLRIELEDLEEDLRMLVALYQQRELRNEITGYVSLENISLLTSEIAGIEKIVRSLDDIVVERFVDLDDMVRHVDALFRARTQSAGFPEAVYEMVKRKLAKVSKYIQSQEV